eukprot:TRINITY_DN16179_c0_g1_i1.p1 TRINITY_DN16179_c0_g1~~TRINITY_DN16179_c0_g1_i1.p1  ORF type:complete len:137 (-),score=3.62 TRINITY_DN16179_c0_g1_i1:14-424(-)
MSSESVIKVVYLILILLATCSHLAQSKDISLKCYTDKLGLKFTWCERTQRTCYVKMDKKRKVLGRGCSTRPAVFHTQCDDHFGSDHQETFCYCSFSLCNAAPSITQNTVANFLLKTQNRVANAILASLIIIVIHAI